MKINLKKIDFLVLYRYTKQAHKNENYVYTLLPNSFDLSILYYFLKEIYYKEHQSGHLLILVSKIFYFFFYQTEFFLY